MRSDDHELMRIAIIGAGIAGLTAARELKAAGHEPVVFEKSAGLGGRLATRRVGEYTFDTGATVISPRHHELTTLITTQLPTDDLVVIQKSIWAIERSRAVPGIPTAPGERRFTYTQGATMLPKLMAEGIEIRRECPVAEIEKTPTEIRVESESFDRLIITAPAPQTELLLASAGIQRTFGGARFRSCISILLGFATPTPDVPYFALIEPEQRQPLLWLSIESNKCAGRAPEGHTAMVAQMSAEFSAAHYQEEDEKLIQDALVPIKRLFGTTFDHPEVAQVKRWKYSQPELMMSFESANSNGSRIIVAGDWTTGGRIELAYDSGKMAAKRVLEV